MLENDIVIQRWQGRVSLARHWQKTSFLSTFLELLKIGQRLHVTEMELKLWYDFVNIWNWQGPTCIYIQWKTCQSHLKTKVQKYVDIDLPASARSLEFCLCMSFFENKIQQSKSKYLIILKISITLAVRGLVLCCCTAPVSSSPPPPSSSLSFVKTINRKTTF